jgi:membrane-associated protein
MVLGWIRSWIDYGANYVTFMLSNYGIWTFAGISMLKGMLIPILVPPESVTTAYVLFEAQSFFEVAFIVLVAAAAITIGNTIIYILARLLGEKLFAPEEDERSWVWEATNWLCGNKPRTSMVLLRLVPVIGDWAAIPAGLAKIRFKHFLLYSFIGFLLYEGLLGFGAYYGIKLGMLSGVQGADVAVEYINQTVANYG